MLKYTKEQLRSRKLRQVIGTSVVITVVLAAVFVTISVATDDTPEFNNNITNETP
jgi:hypothetical protein